jgi:hypothetical protein
MLILNSCFFFKFIVEKPYDNIFENVPLKKMYTADVVILMSTFPLSVLCIYCVRTRGGSVCMDCIQYFSPVSKNFCFLVTFKRTQEPFGCPSSAGH